LSRPDSGIQDDQDGREVDGQVDGRAPSVAAVSSRYVVHAERCGRKLSTRLHIESETRVHLAPFSGDRALDSIDAGEVLDLIGRLESDHRPDHRPTTSSADDPGAGTTTGRRLDRADLDDGRPMAPRDRRRSSAPAQKGSGRRDARARKETARSESSPTFPSRAASG
jgi:hypothetical protein